ncbi:SGNH/GDSL hydrolase family protein [Luteimonas huabeiensis]|uniref:SGNH/GDSL hydrolase family protein n=1 Tax=Luteimonas huabeiensis TaxID=1244513 RepID=UPI00046521DF|nr:SGNH/GDSL hydrolase family protein [Luteimonas huabeiensis]
MRRPLSLLALLLAVAIGAAACAGGPPPVAATAAAAGLDPVSSPDWVQDMARFAAEDAARPPPPRPVVFTGSSSVRLWETLAQDFPQYPVLNRGFGGSHLRDAVHYADEVAIRYRPSRILIYAGDNDTMDGRGPAQVLADFQRFVERIQRDLPGTPVAYISIKPSPSRAQLMPVQREANALIAAWAARTPQVDYIDVFTPMLDADGQPREDLFVADRLHMNAAGYAIWRRVIGDYLRQPPAQ